MTGKITFSLIKPKAVENGYIVPILSKIKTAGFRISALKFLELTCAQAGGFYAIHKDKPFYDDLVKFMSSGPVVAIILEKENAIEDYRKLIGTTNPKDAKEGTIRNAYAESIEKNAVHGSDSDENAIIESNFFFSQLERF